MNERLELSELIVSGKTNRVIYVDNTADLDKPMSTPQINYFNAHKPVIVLTQNEYESLTTIDSSIFYIISDL